MTALHGYPRPVGRAGARNHVLVLPSVVCSTLLAREIAETTGVTHVIHQDGCGHIGRDVHQTRRLLGGLAANPNVADAMIVSLGCETVQGKHVASDLHGLRRSVRLIGIQASGGYDEALRAGIAEARALRGAAARARRTDIAVCEVTVGIAQARPDDRVGDLVTGAVSAGARVVLASDVDAAGPTLSTKLGSIEIGEEPTTDVSRIRDAGSGAQLLAAAASCGAQLIVNFPAPQQPPQGFPVAPVISVPAGHGLHALIVQDFDVAAGSDASEIWNHALEVFSGTPSSTEGRASQTFAIPRLLRSM